MTDADFDDPQVEEDWVFAKQKEVAEYLISQNVEHGEIGEWPAWHIAPFTAIWAIESHTNPGWVGWWVITGDHPTDYISAETIKHPRGALRAFVAQWRDIAAHMIRGEAHPTITMGDASNWNELAQLLSPRIEVFSEWAEDDDAWDYDEAEFESGNER